MAVKPVEIRVLVYASPVEDVLLDAFAGDIHVRVLGGVGPVSDDGKLVDLPRARRQLLSLLVAAGVDGISFGAIADDLWGETLPTTWKSALRMAITRLRRHLSAVTVSNKANWCRLVAAPADVDAWRLLQLAAESGPLAVPIDDAIELLVGEPYPGVEVTALIQAAITDIEAARRTVLGRLVEETAGAPSELGLSKLRSLGDTRPWDAELGHLIRSVIERGSGGAGELTEGIEDARPAHGNSTPADQPVCSPRLLDRAPQQLVGRVELCDEIISRLDGGRTRHTVLAGPSGAGKTAVVAEVGRRMHASGHRVLYLTPLDGPPVALAAFLLEVPELRSAIERYHLSDEPEEKKKSLCWSEILDVLARGRVPTCVITDDTHRLDHFSLELLQFLGRASSELPMLFLFTTLPQVEISPLPWETGEEIGIEPLSTDDLLALVRLTHPLSTAAQQQQLTREAHELSEGLAGRAVRILRSSDPDTLTLPAPSELAGQVPFDLSAGLNDDAKLVAAAAAVLRDPITTEALAEVTQLGVAELAAAVEFLIEETLLVETSRPNTFELSGTYGRGVFEALIPVHRARRLHARAVNSAGSADARAWHMDAARPLVSDDEVVEAYSSAARQHFLGGEHRQAVRAFLAAERLSGTIASWPVTTQIDYATALERSGSDGEHVRQQAFQRARLEGDESLALRAALSGLPEAEKLDGDEGRLEMVATVRADQLDGPDRWLRAFAMSRQALLLGHNAEAREAAVEAMSEADSADLRVEAWLALRHIEGWRPHSAVSDDFAELEAVSDLALRVRARQATVVTLLIDGDLTRAEAEADQLEIEVDRLADPLRAWHYRLIRVLLLEDRLRFEEATSLADTTVREAVAFGIPGAAAARLAQASRRSWITGQGEGLLSIYESAADDVRSSVLARAGFATQLLSAGRARNAVALVTGIVSDSAGSRFEAAALGVLAPVAALASPSLRSRVRTVLEPYADSFLIVGAGVGSLGPVDSLLALLQNDGPTRLALLRNAVQLADRSGSELWRIRTRLALHRETLDEDTLREAEDLCEGTDLPIDVANDGIDGITDLRDQPGKVRNTSGRRSVER